MTTNRLTRIYTKTGDDGTTSLANNVRTSKISPIIYAIGAVDEANSAIGMMGVKNDIIDKIQSDLFDIGADLSGSKNIKISENRITWLENVMDDINEFLNPLTSFILPVGPIHNARAVVRRAEREVWMAIEIHSNNDMMEFNPLITKYLNRLSDFLFIFARYNSDGQEKLWSPNETK